MAKKNVVPVCISFDTALLKKVDALAKKRRLNRSKMIDIIIAAHFEKD